MRPRRATAPNERRGSVERKPLRVLKRHALRFFELWQRSPRRTGRRGERLAARYLRKRGYSILARNLRLGGGEIDLVAEHRETVVLVEVKTRQGRPSVQPGDSVTRAKRRQLFYLARQAQVRHRSLVQNRTIRFDVIEVWILGMLRYRLRHHRGAFHENADDEPTLDYH